VEILMPAPKPHTGTLRSRAAAVTLMLLSGLALTACEVHEISANDTELPGLWRADFPVSTTSRAHFVVHLLPTRGDSLGGRCAVGTNPSAEPSAGCRVLGEIRGDSVYLSFPDYVGTFRGVWQSRYAMVGDLEFNYTTGRQRVTNAYFEKVGGR
jgi:hypothetical protein